MNSQSTAISFRSSSPWAGVLLAAFIGMAVVDLLLLAADSTLALSQREPAEYRMWLDPEGNMALMMDLLTLAWAGAFCVIAVLFLLWFRRGYLNLQAFGAAPESSTKMVFLGFIVPLLNWVQPYVMMREILDKSSLDEQARPTNVAGAWWVSFWVMCLVGKVANTLRPEQWADTTSSHLLLLIVSCLVDLVAIGLAVRLVWTVTAVQDRRGRLLLTPQRGQVWT